MGQVLFFSCCVPDFFSLSLAFRNLTVLCVGVDFFWLILFGVCSAIGICRFLSFAKIGQFSAIISLSTFPALPFSSSRPMTPMTGMLDLLLSSLWSLMLHLFFFSVCFCSVFHTVISAVLSSRSPIFSHLPLRAAVGHIHGELVFQRLPFLVVTFAFSFSLYFPFPCYDFLLLSLGILFLRVFQVCM